MAKEYLRPDVYVEDLPGGVKPVSSVSTSTGAFVGVSPRGKVGEAQLVTSWTDFVDKYAGGLPTPFMSNSDLAYSVYGFFQNGGSRAWVVRVASDSAVKATVTVPASTGIVFTAVEEGTWGNKIEVDVKADGEAFTITVMYDDEIVEVFEEVVKDVTKDNDILEVINGKSKYITVGTNGILAVGEGILIGGADGIAELTDTQYIDALKAFDVVDGINLLAVPGQTSNAMIVGITNYCELRGDCFAILDAPMETTPEAMLALRASVGSDFGAFYYPWIKVVDPLSSTGKLRAVPLAGHIAGICARTDMSRGVHKAPAGIDANVRGAVEVYRKLTNGHVEVLNPKGVNCIVPKPNIGIVVWGARTISPQSTKRYVPVVRLDLMIKSSSFLGTQWAIFEPNDETLWSTLRASLKAYLYTLWEGGALVGSAPEDAYYVKCDEELNPEEIRDQGRVIVEIGYAPVKPAEFVILRFAQKTAGGN